MFGDKVMLTSHFTGTFSNDFELFAMGMGVVPASVKTATFPTSTSKISFDGDKVPGTYNLETGPEAGFPGLPIALGFKRVNTICCPVLLKTLANTGERCCF